jgi:hypothetical protein
MQKKIWQKCSSTEYRVTSWAERSTFTSSTCGDEFYQKSRLLRHIETSHSPRAPAANVEKVLDGLNYPKTKDDLVHYSSQKVSTISKELLNLIKSLPSRTYRYPVEVAKALGVLKSGKMKELRG